jgi:hypothetical protein
MVISYKIPIYEPFLILKNKVAIFFVEAFRLLAAWFSCDSLKVPKREIFVTELFILSDPIWVGDLRNEPKKPFV